jgi:hypothetical protein
MTLRHSDYGLGYVPDSQALTAWDEGERRRRRRAG